jgi:hypothetical protein
LELVTHIARQIWIRRNCFLFEGKFLSPVTLLQQGLDSMEAYRTACSNFEQPRRGEVVTGGLLWQKPAANLVKANWDAALDTKLIGWEWVCLYATMRDRSWQQ